MVAYISKNAKVGAPVIILGALLFILVPSLSGVYPIVLPILAGIAILWARYLYKKGKV